MNPIYTKAESRLNILSIIGPASVTLSILALVIKESPFYIDLSATALIGLLLAWRFKLLGLCLATALLNLVLAYDFFFDENPMTLWEMGFGASLELSFIVTSLASAELKEVFQKACKAACENAVAEIEDWKLKISEVISGREAIAFELENLKSKLLPMQDSVKVQTEKAEMFERLLEMARNEVIEKTASKERAESQYYAEKNQLSVLNTIVSDKENELKSLNALNEKLQGELQGIAKSHQEKDAQIHKQSLKVLDLEWKIERQTEELELSRSKASDAEDKVHSLGEKLEELIDRLKNLQTEKDDLEKAMGEALNPANELPDDPVKQSRELARVSGLYNQLREQFQEKSQMLDETRRTLFLVEEEFALYQKNKLEENIQEQEAFQSYILSLSKTIEALELELNLRG